MIGRGVPRKVRVQDNFVGTGDRNAFYARQLVNGKVVRGNYSDHPKGQKRTTKPVSSIWPAGKVAQPGRMA